MLQEAIHLVAKPFSLHAQDIKEKSCCVAWCSTWTCQRQTPRVPAGQEA